MSIKEAEETSEPAKPEAVCGLCDLALERGLEYEFVTPIDAEGDVLITPDRGMMLPGHMLAVTTDHLTSFAQLDPERLRLLDTQLGLLEGRFGPDFGQYFRLEHGSDNITKYGSGACMDHAHIHMIPAGEDVGAHIQEQLDWQELDSYEDLTEFKGTPYVYLGRLATHYVVPDPRLPGQWVRRQIAEVRNLENWDWLVMDSRNDRKMTYEAIRAIGIYGDE